MLSLPSIVELDAPLTRWTVVGDNSEAQAYEDLLSEGTQSGLYWWLHAGKPLATLLHAARYSNSAQLEHLRSFAKFALPYLGNTNQSSNSFMTDTGCPVELSWDWGWSGCQPSVRYSIEPMLVPGINDPVSTSREHAGLHFANRLADEFGIPLDSFQHFWRTLAIPADQAEAASKQIPLSDRAQFFAGFDMSDSGSVLKAYFLPTLAANAQRRSRFDVVVQAMQRAPGWSLFEPSFSAFDEFLHNTALRDCIDVAIFSLDVTAAVPSRYKLYLRCHETSFASVREVVSLGGRISSAELDQSLTELRGLWTALFQPACVCDECSLPPVEHRTAGMLYYFEFSAGKAVPTPKIYLPVRHYAANDAHVEQAVSRFVTRQASAESGDIAKSVRDFRTALISICGAKTLKQSRGLHTYIGCTLERGKVKVISYINPGHM